MGLIGRILGGPSATTALGQAATGVAEVFRPNATKKMQAAHDAYMAALGEYGAEFQYAGDGIFDRFVNALNRLPRPMLALGTLGLFVYAMVDPDSFTRRMVGLNYVPEPLWWLLAAIVGFYFGAREAHYFRARTKFAFPPTGRSAPEDDAENPALGEWRRHQDR
ncbi:holin family protein [Defluviimonas aestuarii]|uniref:holin family protein n=1 Tax=Albidovulum aestuarii TaxID=1130726 RepID=UPI00249ADE0A|nr:holin family protein [Defluviimonas aestuarii]MDI3335926.1 holin family protein [Defluviimonas aestuarii]